MAFFGNGVKGHALPVQLLHRQNSFVTQGASCFSKSKSVSRMGILRIILMCSRIDMPNRAARRIIAVMINLQSFRYRTCIDQFPGYNMCAASNPLLFPFCWYAKPPIAMALSTSSPLPTTIGAIGSVRALLDLCPKSYSQRFRRPHNGIASPRTVFNPFMGCQKRVRTRRVLTEQLIRHRQPPEGWMIPKVLVQQPVGNRLSGATLAAQRNIIADVMGTCHA
jgi:hypothetical protein